MFPRFCTWIGTEPRAPVAASRPATDPVRSTKGAAIVTAAALEATAVRAGSAPAAPAPGNSTLDRMKYGPSGDPDGYVKLTLTALDLPGLSFSVLTTEVIWMSPASADWSWEASSVMVTGPVRSALPVLVTRTVTEPLLPETTDAGSAPLSAARA